MGRLTVTAFTTLDNVAEEPQLRSDVLLVSPIVRGHGRKTLSEDGTQHTLPILEQRLLEGGMLALRMTPAAAESTES
ncbi:MAG: hypothetical protein M3017_14570 [Actinomycetota bacterium]|nr:hypothetical protein [Actinomycetota bacterium]